MKKTIVLLLVFVQINVTLAQFKVTENPSTRVYSVDPDPLYPQPGIFDDLDLITWVFPDGQFRQQTVQVDPNTKAVSNNTITWQPIVDPFTNPGPDKVVAYVAKKGGQTNPGRYVATPTVGLQPGATAFNFSMPPTSLLQINTGWDFSGNRDNVFITSYRLKTDSICFLTNNYIDISFDPRQLQVKTNDNLYYKNELLTSDNTLGNARISNFTNLSYTGHPIHVFNLFAVDKSVQKGDKIRIVTRYNLCGVSDSIVSDYVAKGTPHDPNLKTVDIDTICPNQGPIQLTYTIRFHNDGNTPVNKVEVNDILPPELQISTVNMVNDPKASWNVAPTKRELRVTFQGLNLPGIQQIAPAYTYDQTLYSFSFTALTEPNFNNTFDNMAEVIFFDDATGKGLTPINTIVARVVTSELPGCYVPVSEVPNILRDLIIAPNPFSDQVSIGFELLEDSRLTLDLRDISGKAVRQLGAGVLSAGPHRFDWAGAEVPAGVYFLSIGTPTGIITRKMIKI